MALVSRTVRCELNMLNVSVERRVDDEMMKDKGPLAVSFIDTCSMYLIYHWKRRRDECRSSVQSEFGDDIGSGWVVGFGVRICRAFDQETQIMDQSCIPIGGRKATRCVMADSEPAGGGLPQA